MISGNTACALGRFTEARQLPLGTRYPSTSVGDAFGKYAENCALTKKQAKRISPCQAEDDWQRGMYRRKLERARSSLQKAVQAFICERVSWIGYFAEIPNCFDRRSASGTLDRNAHTKQQSDILGPHTRRMETLSTFCFFLLRNGSLSYAESFDLAEKLQSP